MVRFPDLRLGWISFVNMLSMSELLIGLSLVGIVMAGRMRFDVNISKKSYVGLWLLVFRRSRLKSPVMYLGLLSFPSLSFNGLMYSSVKVFGFMLGCLYTTPTILLDEFWLTTSRKYDSSSLGL